MDLTAEILLLNNKPDLADYLRQYLSLEFSKVDCLHESRQAIGPLARGEYKLLVLSNHLNDMEGLEFVRLLRKEAISIPFVMIAGDSDIRQAVEVMKEGAVEFLQWSDDTDAFFPYVAEVLRRALYLHSKLQLVSESELLYKTLFENIRDAVFVHFVDDKTRQPTTFIEVNQVACRRLGYSREEFASMTPFDIDVPGSVDMKAVMEDLCLNGSVIFSTFHATKNRQHIPVEINSRLFDLKGQKAILSVARNITDQQKALDELKNSELRFRSIIEKCIVGICITDEKGFFEYVNDEYCRIYSYTSEEMLGKHAQMIVAGEHKQMMADLHDEFILTGKMIKNEWHVVDKYGSSKIAVADAARVTDVDGRYRKITFVQDVTEERQFKEALELSEVKYRTMMESLQDPVYISDRNYNIIFTNKAYQKRFGKVKEGARCYNEVFGEKHPCSWCKATIEGKTTVRKRMEKTINKRDYEVTTVPIQFEDVYMAKMTILRDVTKTVKARRRAEESDKLKSAFLANVSHEIRTPLNAVLGFSSLLKDEDITRDETLMYVDMINESSAHLMHVMDNIIEFSFIDSGLVKVEPVLIDTDGLLKDIGEEAVRMQTKMNKNNLKIAFHNRLPDELSLVCDQVRVRQVLLNLVSNALKFTEIGGVTVTIFQSQNKWVVFSVKDSGIGIPKEKQEVIFRRFRQVDEGQTRMFGGNGLGLALSKHLALMMGGYIKLESVPGKGSEFQLFLPENFDQSLTRVPFMGYIK